MIHYLKDKDTKIGTTRNKLDQLICTEIIMTTMDSVKQKCQPSLDLDSLKIESLLNVDLLLS